MGIPLFDHLIIGRNGVHYSFADGGDISPQTAGYRHGPSGERVTQKDMRVPDGESAKA